MVDHVVTMLETVNATTVAQGPCEVHNAAVVERQKYLSRSETCGNEVL